MTDFNLETIKRYQKELSNLVGVSGFEDAVSSYLLDELESNNLVDKAWIDAMGNLLAVKNGTEENERILFDAHTDEIGFMVSHIDKRGFLRFQLIGGWDKRILPGKPVILQNDDGTQFHGIIGAKPPHLTSIEERKKLINVSSMYIDLGMSSSEEVKKNNINIGSVGTVFTPFVEMGDGMVRGKAFDDRTGCNVLLQLLKLLKGGPELKSTLLFNFAVQEELGMRGAITGTFNLNPTMGIAIENTTAADVPDIKESECPAYLGKGPAITIADKSMISSRYMNKRLVHNAKMSNIPCQYKRPLYGATDASQIQRVKAGVPTTVVSVPCRYIHSSTSLLKIQDIYDTVLLLDVFITNKAGI